MKTTLMALGVVVLIFVVVVGLYKTGVIGYKNIV